MAMHSNTYSHLVWGRNGPGRCWGRIRWRYHTGHRGPYRGRIMPDPCRTILCKNNSANEDPYCCGFLPITLWNDPGSDSCYSPAYTLYWMVRLFTYIYRCDHRKCNWPSSGNFYRGWNHGGHCIHGPGRYVGCFPH